MTDDDSKKNPLGPVGDRVAENVKNLREASRVSYRELSEGLGAVGRPIPTLGLSRIEKHTRRVDADDLVALALSLGVTPNRLLLPAEDTGAPVHLTARRVAGWEEAWHWVSGDHPLEVDVPDRMVDATNTILAFIARNRPQDHASPFGPEPSAAWELVDKVERLFTEAHASGMSANDIGAVVDHVFRRRRFVAPSVSEDADRG